MNKWVICDLDGCISDDNWRKTKVLEPAPNLSADEIYGPYNEACDGDQVISSNLMIIESLYAAGNNILFLTARPEAVKEKTKWWIHERTGITKFVLAMRDTGDHRHSPILKPALLCEFMASKGIGTHDILVCFDDREDVLAAYRKLGLCSVWLGIPNDNHVPDINAIGSPIAETLQLMAATANERNSAYGANYKMIAPLVRILFPNGVPPEIVIRDGWHLFELILVKLSRFATSNLTHVDSIHDAAIYAAMIETTIKEEAK